MLIDPIARANDPRATHSPEPASAGEIAPTTNLPPPAPSLAASAVHGRDPVSGQPQGREILLPAARVEHAAIAGRAPLVPARPRSPQTRHMLPPLIDALLRAPSLETLFEILPPLAASYINCRRVILYIVRNGRETQLLDFVGCTADATTQSWSSTLIRMAPIEPIALNGTTPEARALRGEQPLFVPATEEIPARFIMPMHAIGGPVGAIVAIPSDEEGAWGADGLRASQTFMHGLVDVARICAIVLQNRLLFMEQRERSAQMDLLQRLTTAFNSSVLDLEAAVGIVERQLSQVTRANFAAVALGPIGPTPPPPLSPQGRWLRPELVRALLQQRGAIPLILDDLDHWSFAPLLPPDVTSFYAFPLVAEDRVAGYLTLAYHDRHTLTESEQSLIAILANTASTVLLKSRLHAEADLARRQSRDLLERVQREERIKDAILRNIQSGLLVVDNGGRVLLLNPAGAAILGNSERQALGQNVEEIMSLAKPGPHPVRASIGPRVPPRHLEVRARTTAGNEVVLILTITPLRLADGKEMGVVCAFQDITEVRALQEQAKQFEESSKAASHDTRNLAQALMAFLHQWAPKLEADPELRGALSRLRKTTGQLKILAENIMSLGRPVPPQLAISDATELIEQVLRTLEYGARATHVHIERRLEPGATVLADEYQLMRVLENLCINAIEAMPKGGTLTVTTRTNRGGPAAPNAALDPRAASTAIQTDLLLPETRQRAIEIEIADTGVGIAPERLSEIWEPFKTYGKRNGTGLGLAIVRQLIEAHGGTIAVTSEVNQGTIFVLRLPAGRGGAA